MVRVRRRYASPPECAGRYKMSAEPVADVVRLLRVFFRWSDAVFCMAKQHPSMEREKVCSFNMLRSARHQNELEGAAMNRWSGRLSQAVCVWFMVALTLGSGG